MLAKAGVTFAFSSGGYEFSRDVPFQAGRSVAWGLDHDTAIKLNPAFSKPFNNRGVALVKKGEYDRAIKDFDEAAKNK